jgi:hypothetical protein
MKLLFLSCPDATANAVEAESSKRAMHDIDKSLSIQAAELANYQNRCNELAKELADLQTYIMQSEMTSKVSYIYRNAWYLRWIYINGTCDSIGHIGEYEEAE